MGAAIKYIRIERDNMKEASGLRCQGLGGARGLCLHYSGVDWDTGPPAVLKFPFLQLPLQPVLVVPASALSLSYRAHLTLPQTYS
ncbi:hypothetical protein M407DRAFT_173557 [Tulasnella calospora MUT 4182]|uniref:Uncharacterized protein n=1 Tax=Tulasnella calospora MUT 4182 TaxID=1051891 RepID=A0A0C3QP57_9AGAM|nr:hypothetical protein M407DRAFT_173557 [Tulasnella calospora MUT 4182]